MTNFMTLAERLAQINAESKAWVAEDPENRWASGLVDDLAHWAQYGITTAEGLDHYLLVTDAYENSKAAGWRRDWSELNVMTNAELEEIISIQSKQ